MTMPHLMNCAHSPDGWCLDCVKAMGDELIALKHQLRKARFPCVDCDAMSECDCAFDGYNVTEIAGLTCLASR